MQATAPKSHSHVSTKGYVGIALILAVVTLVEFGIVYVPSLASVMIPLLGILSVAKFALVAMYFMHLKGDLKVYTYFITGGLFAAAIVTVSLKLLLDAGHLSHR